jgi:hypothetical protein
LFPVAQAQSAKKTVKSTSVTDTNKDNDHEEERAEWFAHGRKVPGKSAADLRYRAYQAKMQARIARQALTIAARRNSQALASSDGWTPLGPVPLASDGTGTGFQDYHQVAGRATAVVIDPADGTGNTIYIGGAQGGVWKSTNAATSIASDVTWTTVTDDQATLSIGSLAIQPGNTDSSKSVILVGTGEANDSGDSYFGLGILRSADGGNTWALIPSANSGSLSFSGLGGTRMAFSTTSTNTVVAAMAASTEGAVDGALTPNTYRGLYTSSDAGQTWTYDALFSGGTSEATSATSVVYNATAGLFFAALRYHGFYSSPDGLTWTPLAVQPGAPGLLSTTACPQSYTTTCPIYRGEITVVPGRNEMYVWFVSLDANNNPVDQGIWQSENSGASWTQINDSGIINCGDFNGCGVEQGPYNLALLAVPNGPSATDLYAGAINLYKCSISSINQTCASTPFLNLTHVYGCDPLGALAHVHPDQHALAYTIPASSGAELMYFANDGGIYRALNGYTGLLTGSCSGTNQFDDLNQNLGSMTQFVSFSQHPTDPNTIFGGTQDNGSPATSTAMTSLSWGNILSGDGGYNALDSNTSNWFASNPDTGFGSLNIQECSSGTNCTDSSFTMVVSSGDVGGDDGAFYFPYILDPQSTSSMLVGTCRVWQGPRSGGAFTALSLNFETFGAGTCAGDEVNAVLALAAGGPTNANGSQVIYATTDGPGPGNLGTPVGGNVWATTNATAVSGTSSTFANVTLNGPGGISINPNQFPISSVAIDTSDPTGNTAYVTEMGFTGGPGHVWRTTNAGASWSDVTGTGTSALPDSPVNAVVVDPLAHVVYVGTDVGVFQSLTSSAAWTELGPSPSGEQTGFLPNVAVTALAIFNSGGQKLLRASTYGRGVWQYNLLAVPDFQITVPNPTLTVFPGSTVNYPGTLTSIDGYDNSVELSCTAGTSSPPATCIPTPGVLTPTPAGVGFSLNAGSSTIGDYNFNLQGAGSDPNNTTHVAALTLHVVNFSMTTPSPSSVVDPRGATSPPVSFQLNAQGSFNQSVTLSCSFTPNIVGATCAFTPGATFNLTSANPVNATTTVTVPAGTTTGNYGVTLQANTAGATLTASFIADVVPNPTFVLKLTNTVFPNVKAGSTGTTGAITIQSQDEFSGSVNLSCLTSLNNTCGISPGSVTVPSNGSASATLTINAGALAAGSYQITAQGTSGPLTSSLVVPFIVDDYLIAGPPTLLTVPGATVTANLTFSSEDSYIGSVVATCDATALAGAQCVFSPPSPITIGNGAVVAIAANITVPNTAVVGTYNVAFNTHDESSDGEPSHNLTTALTVQDFTFSSITPPTQSIGAGNKALYNLSLAPLGASFSSPVALSCSVSAPNSTCTVNPSTVTPNSGPTVITATIATNTGGGVSAQGSYSVTVTGASGGISHSVTFPLTVANSFQLTVTNPFPGNLAANSSKAPATITLTPNYSGSVTTSCVAVANSNAMCTIGSPSSISFSSSPVTITVLLAIFPSAIPGTYTVTINVADSSGAPSQSMTLSFTVAQDYIIANLSSASQTITAGQSITYNLSLAPVGAAYSNEVTLSCTGTPLFSGSCTFSPNPAGPLSNSTSSAVVMTVATPSAQARLGFPKVKRGPWLASVWLAITAAMVWSGSRRRRRRSATLVLVLALSFLLSCGGAGSNGGSSTPGSNPQGTPITYTITVVGSPPSISQPSGATVTLIVNP